MRLHFINWVFLCTSLAFSLSNCALSGNTAEAQVNLQFPFTQGEFWRVSTYEGHYNDGPQYAVDFWWASPQRADTYFSDPASGLGKMVRAAHDGRVFLFAFEITDFGLTGKAERVRYDPATDTISPQIPKATFVLETDKDGNQRVIDLELVVLNEANHMLTLYVHSKISPHFFTDEVLKEIKEAVRQFYNKTAPGVRPRVAIDSNQDINAYTPIGFVDAYGHASGPHLHFQVHLDTSFNEQNPFLGNPHSLNSGNILIDGDVVFEEAAQWTHGASRLIYDYPAMPRNRFNVGDLAEVMNPLANSVNVRSTPGGVILGEVSNGTIGQILSDSEKMSIDGRDCVDTTTCYIWWRIQFPTQTGWVVSPYLIIDVDSLPCSRYASGDLAPTPYGLAWNWFSSEKELLLSAACDPDQTTITVGSEIAPSSGHGRTLSWSKAYAYDGTSWNVDKPIPVTCEGETIPVADVTPTDSLPDYWCNGTLSGTLPSNGSFFAAYTCIFTGTTWQCGCTDSSCTRSFWQLQGIER